jgi:MraZ protein
VPANLRSYAGIALKDDVILTGADSRIEVWSKAQWNEYTSEIEPDVTSIAACLADLGI